MFRLHGPVRAVKTSRGWAHIPFMGGLALLAMLSCVEPASIQPGGPANYIIDNDTVQAARTGDNETLRENLIKGISPNESGKDNIPMLILAAGSGHLSTVKLLLEYGADPDRRAPDRATALTIVSLANRADIAEALLEAGADPDKPGANREVPLLIATRARSSAIVEMLLRYGVDTGETDVTGRSALDLAEENHYRDIAVLLRTVAAQ